VLSPKPPFFAIFFFEKMACLPIFYHQGTMKTGVPG